MLKRTFICAMIALMILITILSAVNAYPYVDPYYAPASPNYVYYDEGYDNLPVVAGPYPRYYLGFNNYRNNDDDIFLHDDFNHYDTYIGYRDLDVYYPDRGYVDVLRNPEGDLTPLEVPDQVYRFADNYHVYGYLPNGGVYTKHYYHDHEWGLESTDCGYYDYGYYEPASYYVSKPVFTKNCYSAGSCNRY